jgi:hypothetical protein
VSIRAAIAAATFFFASEAAFVAEAGAIEVETYRIDHFGIGSEAQVFGSLRYLGGIGVTSRDNDFGGFSGVEITDGGTRIVLVSDGGDYLTAALRHDGDAIIGLDDIALQSLFPSGEEEKQEVDAEDFVFDPDDPSRGYIVRERRTDALFAFDLVDGRPENFAAIDTGAPAELLKSNRGLESVAIAPPASPIAGSVVVILEAARKVHKGAAPAWIVGGGQFGIRESEAYDISSARFLDDGDLLVLERRYSPGWGVGVRLRRIDGASITPGAIVDGETIMEAGLAQQIDNMEGLALHRDQAGRTILTLVSDDNHSILQRTLILQFALGED